MKLRQRAQHMVPGKSSCSASTGIFDSFILNGFMGAIHSSLDFLCVSNRGFPALWDPLKRLCSDTFL